MADGATELPGRPPVRPMGARSPTGLTGHFRSFAAVVERDGGTTYPAICRRWPTNPRCSPCRSGPRLPTATAAAARRGTTCCSAGHDHPLAAFYDTVAAFRATEPPGADDPGDVGDGSSTSATYERSASPIWLPDRPRPTRWAGAPPCCRASCHIASLDTADPSTCSTSGPRPGSLCSSTSTPTPTASDGPGVRLPAHRRRRSRSSARCGPTCSISPTPEPPAVAERVGSGPRPGGPVLRRSRPGGCSPASGPTTRHASDACGPRWPSARRRLAPTPARAGRHGRRPPRGGRDLGRPRDHSSCSTPGWPPTSTRNASGLWPQRCGSSMGTSGSPPLLRVACRDTRTARHRRHHWQATVRTWPRSSCTSGRTGPAPRLADTHPHGYWLHWWPLPDGP